MSYARFGPTSSVYVFYSVGDFFECCGCIRMESGLSFRTPSRSKMIAHLEAHLLKGDKVEPDVIPAIAAEEWGEP